MFLSTSVPGHGKSLWVQQALCGVKNHTFQVFLIGSRNFSLCLSLSHTHTPTHTHPSSSSLTAATASRSAACQMTETQKQSFLQRKGWTV